ncbi:MAG: hypothetical protein HC918_07740 [Oscillatoriales cyanobacterium SM2_1_8]|nr:hypothetical protein [Oscillatoriales cyanobacterium SM2_1_8]
MYREKAAEPGPLPVGHMAEALGAMVARALRPATRWQTPTSEAVQLLLALYIVWEVMQQEPAHPQMAFRDAWAACFDS